MRKNVAKLETPQQLCGYNSTLFIRNCIETTTDALAVSMSRTSSSDNQPPIFGICLARYHEKLTTLLSPFTAGP